MANNINNAEDFDPNLIQINGPLNVVRLQGTINGIYKVIYLFMDIHEDVSKQTECTNIFSKDIQNYFSENFYSLNDGKKIYDFFFEITPSRIQYPNLEYRKYKDKYIMEVNKLFKRVFKYDKSQNKVGISDIFKNVRLHYLDIRDYFEIEVYDKLTSANYEIMEFYRYGFSINGFENILDNIVSAKKQLQFVVDTLKKSEELNKNNKTKLIKLRRSGAADPKAVQRLAFKIKYRYNYQNIREILNKLLQEIISELIKYLDNMDKIIVELEQYYDFYLKTGEKLIPDTKTTIVYNYGITDFKQREIMHNMADHIEYLLDNFLDLFAKLVDIYFLRRFLDKDYITNAIVYCGMAHSVNYIHILVNYFGFEVTHTARSELDLDDLMLAIKKYSMVDLIPILSPPTPYQCSDITHFPDKFL